MTLLGKRVVVAFPDTVLEEKGDLNGKTAKLGTLARACAIFGVDRIEVFRDPKKRGEPELVRKVLEYLETPQYLRKRLFPLDESLRYAGVLPPLRIPSHRPRITMAEVKVGDVREGVVEADGTVDIGLDVRPRLNGSAQSGQRITAKVESLRPFVAKRMDRKEAAEYWGYDVAAVSFDEVLGDRTTLRVATSRLGESLSSQIPGLRAAVSSSKGVKLIFGSPSRGLYDMSADLKGRADFVVNLFGEQHTETVRTEEAVFAGLGLLDTLLSEKA
ncbi:MAG TPA: putative RNA uridine N3 methyltransferase [Nitrososphaerales archaeon]|nr:putative RNA uridine N3 methyltransferase [Nitrososphaerales archaeon]